MKLEELVSSQLSFVRGILVEAIGIPRTVTAVNYNVGFNVREGEVINHSELEVRIDVSRSLVTPFCDILSAKGVKHEIIREVEGDTEIWVSFVLRD